MKNNLLRLSFFVIVYFLLTNIIYAQYEATSASTKAGAFEIRTNLQQNSPLKNLPFRNIGPTVMSGRVADLEVNPKAPHEFYVAYASGGLWYTNTNGINFEPIFDHQAVMTIGDIAVIWGETNQIWVGTGENNSSRSSYAGNGVYYSADGGHSWTHRGLGDTQHTGRIIIHPDDPNTLWVAAIGNLYTESEERGVFKSTDGGTSWDKVLYINEGTGAIDLVVHPKNADVLMAAMWERKRDAWHFQGNGDDSGIWKSTDGGENWEQLNTADSGFPSTEGVGRIGLAYAPSNPDIVYAVLDNQDHREKEESESYIVTKDKLRKMSAKDFAKLSDEDINDFLDRENFPQKFNAVDLKKQVADKEIQPDALVDYLEDANAMLFDTPIKGAEMYRSNDGGKSWFKTHEGYIENLVYTYGYYFGQVRVDAQNPDIVYTMGVPLIQSKDGGKSWKSISKENVHADHHAMWINPELPGHLVNGNDGGVNISYDDGQSWFKANTPSVGQFYTVAVDMAKPYNVYGGLQDNGVWYGSSQTEESRSWHQSGQNPYRSIMGGDGMQVAIDLRDNETVYTGYQFGNYFKINTRTGDRSYITPKHELGERPLRWNWQSPIMLSSHNSDIVYFGSNRFHRSMDQGKNFEALSADLTKGGKKGNVPYGTLTSISESPKRFGLIYVGSDDGYIHRSDDGGYSWERVSDDLPQDLWVSRVYASHHHTDRVYASLNGYRFDHMDSYVYRSDDRGKTWTRIATDLPTEPVNVIKEDPHHENILYIGTDHHVYASLDGGESVVGMSPEMPHVPVHDLVVHPRDHDLVLGTHGRSFFIADLEPVYAYAQHSDKLHIMDLEGLRYNRRWGADRGFGEYWEPEVSSWIISPASGEANLRIMHDNGSVLHEQKHTLDKGINAFSYDLKVDKPAEEAYSKYLEEQKIEMNAADNGAWYLHAGTYTIELSMGKEKATTQLTIQEARERPARKPQKKTP